MYTSPADTNNTLTNVATTIPATQQKQKVFFVAQLRHLYTSMAPVSNAVLAQVGEQQADSTGRDFNAGNASFGKLSPDIVQLLIEEAVRLVPDSKMPAELAKLRRVSRLFEKLADNTELQAKDIAYASTERKTFNILKWGDPGEERNATLKELYKVWPHIEVPLSKLQTSADRKFLLDALAEQHGKASLSLQLHNVDPGEFDSMRLVAANNRGTPIKLDMGGSTLTPDQMKELLFIFAENQSRVVELALRSIFLNAEAWQTLSPAIGSFSELKNLDFTSALNCSMSVELLANALPNLASLEKLRLRFVPIDTLAMRSLGLALLRLRSFDELDLIGNGIDVQTMNELTVLRDELPPIKKLSLDLNPLGIEGMNALCPLLSALGHSLESLTLNGTEMDGNAARLLAAALPQLVHLKELSLDTNRFGGDGMQALIPALSTHPAIQKLSVLDCGIDYEQATALVGALAEHNSSLRHFSLNWSGSRRLDSETLRPTLERIPSLRTATLPAFASWLQTIHLRPQ